uniref:DUF3707 domain-containing protein n=1 Tax=Mesocestoides corti TaxID=53468 RepID=A0A5K3FW07_MESCO
MQDVNLDRTLARTAVKMSFSGIEIGECKFDVKIILDGLPCTSTSRSKACIASTDTSPPAQCVVWDSSREGNFYEFPPRVQPLPTVT